MKLTIVALLTAFIFSSCASTATSSSSVKPYPKKICLVTDNKLGSMGDPITIIHDGQEIKFCCQPCVAKFNANPEKFLKKL